jgi:hypothetical protein
VADVAPYEPEATSMGARRWRARGTGRQPAAGW